MSNLIADCGAIAGDNRLPILAEKIRTAHCGVLDAAKTAAERAIEAGRALIEAKELVQHGGWGRWLQDNCQISERTAQLYMQIAKTGLDSATVADLGLKGAAKVLCVIKDKNYDPFFHCDAAAIREWHLLASFLVLEYNWPATAAGGHIEWLLQRPFKTVDEWLGPEGVHFRKIHWMEPVPSPCIEAWSAFRENSSAQTTTDIVAELDRLALAKPASRKRRRRSKFHVAGSAA